MTETDGTDEEADVSGVDPGPDVDRHVNDGDPLEEPAEEPDPGPDDDELPEETPEPQPEDATPVVSPDGETPDG